LRLREKNGKVNEMPCHHKLENYLDAYIEAGRGRSGAWLKMRVNQGQEVERHANAFQDNAALVL
jgi:hypothetical protein